MTSTYCTEPWCRYKSSYATASSYNVTCISPLVFSAFVGMEKADTITYKHLAHLLSEKWSSPYSGVMCRLRCSLEFSLLHSSVMCIRDHVLDPSIPVCLKPPTLLLLRVPVSFRTIILILYSACFFFL